MRLTAKSSYLERRITRRRGSQFWVIRGGSNLDHGRNFSPRFLLHHVALLQWLSMGLMDMSCSLEERMLLLEPASWAILGSSDQLPRSGLILLLRISVVMRLLSSIRLPLVPLLSRTRVLVVLLVRRELLLSALPYLCPARSTRQLATLSQVRPVPRLVLFTSIR